MLTEDQACDAIDLGAGLNGAVGSLYTYNIPRNYPTSDRYRADYAALLNRIIEQCDTLKGIALDEMRLNDTGGAACVQSY